MEISENDFTETISSKQPDTIPDISEVPSPSSGSLGSSEKKPTRPRLLRSKGTPQGRQPPLALLLKTLKESKFEGKLEARPEGIPRELSKLQVSQVSLEVCHKGGTIHYEYGCGGTPEKTGSEPIVCPGAPAGEGRKRRRSPSELGSQQQGSKRSTIVWGSDSEEFGEVKETEETPNQLQNNGLFTDMEMGSDEDSDSDGSDQSGEDDSLPLPVERGFHPPRPTTSNVKTFRYLTRNL